MSRIYAIPYMVYFRAHDDATAARFGMLMGNRLTQGLRQGMDAWIPDRESVAVPAGDPIPATPADHAAALSYTPPRECWEDLPQQVIDVAAGTNRHIPFLRTDEPEGNGKSTWISDDPSSDGMPACARDRGMETLADLKARTATRKERDARFAVLAAKLKTKGVDIEAELLHVENGDSPQ